MSEGRKVIKPNKSGLGNIVLIT